MPYFDNKSIQQERNIIHQQQWQNTIYQNSLQPLMSLELDQPSQQQYNATTQPVLLMSLVLPSYDSPSIKLSKAHTKFRVNNRIYKHFNHNPKSYDRIQRHKYYHYGKKYKLDTEFIDDTVTDTKMASMAQNVGKTPEDNEKTPRNDESLLDIYTIVDTESIELS
ncbi:unnamed protein product [Rotaria magnacalcarata]|nr:unnamed protein product [Rotaria magnacalcarata]CAF1520538.1 unnamed protein product [Rotaria magnacalcarata]CAF3810160.1 unnamed protein product [Rotaria magnacalcarata]